MLPYQRHAAELRRLRAQMGCVLPKPCTCETCRQYAARLANFRAMLAKQRERNGEPPF